MKRSVGCGCCAEPVCAPCADTTLASIDVLTITVSGVADNGCSSGGPCTTLNDTWELEQIRGAGLTCEWWYGGFPGDAVSMCSSPAYSPLLQSIFVENTTPSPSQLRIRLTLNVDGYSDPIFYSQDLGNYDDAINDLIDCTDFGTLTFTYDSGSAGPCDTSSASITGSIG